VADGNGDWLGQRDATFATYDPLAGAGGVFTTIGNGVVTSRDAWAYASSKAVLTEHALSSIEFFNASRGQSPLPIDTTKISWSRALIRRAEKGAEITFDPKAIIESVYRPFFRQYLYSGRELIEGGGILKTAFPAEHENFGFYVVGAKSAVPFSALMINAAPDLHVTGAGSGGQFVPRYLFKKKDAPDSLALFGDEESYARIDNVSDMTLARYRAWYGEDVTRDQIFNFVYGLMHVPGYRERFTADLAKVLPRIPRVRSVADFVLISETGEMLGRLHAGYEKAELYPIRTVGDLEMARVTRKKMKYGGKSGNIDRSTLIFNDYFRMEGIPAEAHAWMIGSKTALDWLIDRYYVSTNASSGITNDVNLWGAEHNDPSFVVNLVKRVVTVAVETDALLRQLEEVQIAD
jgi:predicted helicase